MMITPSMMEIERPRRESMSSFSSFGDINSDEFNFSNDFHTATNYKNSNMSSIENVPLTSITNHKVIHSDSNKKKCLLNQIYRKRENVKALIANFWHLGSSSPQKRSIDYNNNFLSKNKSEETLCARFHPIDVSSERSNNNIIDKKNATWR